MNPPTFSESTTSIIEADQLKLFVAGVTDYAIYMLSTEGIVSSWNAGAERFKGYTAEEIIGKHFSRFYTEEDKQRNLPAIALQTAIAQGKFEDEGWRVRKDGTRFWVSVVLDAIKDNSGKLIGFTKITRDITDRKQANDELHASEERFRLLVQGVTDYAIYMLSAEGIITNWNAGAKRIKGFDGAEVIGAHFSRFYTEADRAENLPMKALAAAAATGSFESEGWRLRKDGSKFWAHVVIDPIRNEQGDLLGFAKVTRDITERREAAKALDKAKEALAHAQKMEAIGRLTGGVAHDFNNLLSVMTNGVAILRMLDPNAIAATTLDSMERATSRGTALIQQLLSFARKQPLKQEQHNINSVISSFESVLRRANKSSIKFDIKLTSSLPTVMIDATQLEASLLNLVINAGDAIAESGTITLQTEEVELLAQEIHQLAAGKYVKISVRDTGEGMPADIISRVVEPFFTTKPIGKGTGLGLSQVFGLVQQSKGDIHIISEVGKGTDISLYLPALDSILPSQAAKNDGADKALVVDDQPDVLYMAAEVFRLLGYQVIEANNSEDALKILQRTPDIDVLFSDIVMPGINGIELARKARVLLPTIKIILSSGYTGSTHLPENVALDEFQFIAKPYQISELAKKLRTNI